MVGYEGKPATYLVERTEALRRELAEVRKEVETLEKSDVTKVNGLLRSEGLPEMEPPERLLSAVRSSEVPDVNEDEATERSGRERDEQGGRANRPRRHPTRT